MKYKVLYVEDEPSLARIVSDGLASSGYQVELVTDGSMVLQKCKELEPDICILDIMLPSKDGYAIARELREHDLLMPIIFLTAKILTDDVVKGFNSGGDDYLKKPFSMDELLVRMKALLGRFNRNTASLNTIISTYSFGNCLFDISRQKLKTSTSEHLLSYKEAILLEMMILNKNEILYRKDALNKIWGDDSYYNSRSMDVYMAHLRKLLKDEEGIQILSVRSLGYKLLC